MPGRRNAAEDALRRFALTLPEAEEASPWGHIAVKVRKKTFVFLGGDAAETDVLSVTVKLPRSADFALTLPQVTRTGYGLGASGWVTAKFGAKDKPDLAMLREWIAQSYVAVAPKKLGCLVASTEA